MTAKRFVHIVFPGAYGILVYATVRLLQDTASGFHFWTRPLGLNLFEIMMSVLVGYLSTALVKWVCAYHDRRPSPHNNSSWLLVKEIAGVAAINVVVVNTILTPMAAFTDDGLSRSDFAYINTVPLLYMLIYYGWFRSRQLLTAYVRQQVLVEKINNDRLDTELKFLKAQYHPHFLFNALNTVYFQMDEDVPAAKQSIEKLSALLRYQLYDQQEKVTMDRELEYLYNFIELQKIRTSALLTVSLETDERVRSMLVYPLLFLPLAENAFKYAGGRYVISLSVAAQETAVIFKVSNSLPGLPRPKIKAGGIGLDNLQRRLALLYPGKHGLVIEQDNENFTATLTLETA